MNKKIVFLVCTAAAALTISALGVFSVEKDLFNLGAAATANTMTFDIDSHNIFTPAQGGSGSYNFHTDKGNVVPFSYTQMSQPGGVALYWSAGGTFFNTEEIRAISKIEISGTYLASFDLQWGYDKYNGTISYEGSSSNAFTFANTDQDQTRSYKSYSFASGEEPNYFKLTQTSDQWGGRGAYGMKIYFSPTCTRTTRGKEPYPQYKKTAETLKYEANGYKNAIKDETFRNGFRVTKKQNSASYYSDNSYIFKNPIKTYDDSMWDKVPSPNWQITQWMSNSLIDPDAPSFWRQDNGTQHTIRDKASSQAKSLIFDTATGNFTMECNCGEEYPQNKHERSEGYGGEWWVHFLIEQDWAPNTANCVNVNSCSSIIPQVSYKVTTNNKGTMFNKPDASTFEYYMKVQNLNSKSAGYGSYMWVGFDLYDNRSVGNGYNQSFSYENGSGVVIAKPASTSVLSNSGKLPGVGTAMTCKLADAKSFIQTAYNSDKAATFRQKTAFSDLYVAGFNIGFEIHNHFQTIVECSNMGIYYK